MLKIANDKRGSPPERPYIYIINIYKHIRALPFYPLFKNYHLLYLKKFIKVEKRTLNKSVQGYFEARGLPTWEIL